LQAGIAAFRAGQPPFILQVFDVGTGVIMDAEGAILPVRLGAGEGRPSVRQEPVHARHRRPIIRSRTGRCSRSRIAMFTRRLDLDDLLTA